VAGSAGPPPTPDSFQVSFTVPGGGDEPPAPTYPSPQVTLFGLPDESLL